MKLRTFVLSIVAVVALASTVQAQYGPDQQKALKGLQRVIVRFADPNNKIDAPFRQQIMDAALLELRKSGLRIARDSTDFDRRTDAVINLSLYVATGFSDAVDLRMDVEQTVVVQRTQQPLWLVTWYHEDRTPNASWRESAQPLVIKGVNRLLSDWLSANGR